MRTLVIDVLASVNVWSVEVGETSTTMLGVDLDGINWEITLRHSGFGMDPVRAFALAIRAVVTKGQAFRLVPEYHDRSDRWYVTAALYSLPIENLHWRELS